MKITGPVPFVFSPGNDQYGNTDSSSDSTFTSSTGSSSGGSGSSQSGTSNSRPIVTGLEVTGGTTSGGTTVDITGEHFLGATGVYFGGVAALSFRINSDTSITAVAPAQTTPLVHVTVTGPTGTSTSSSSDLFSYIASGSGLYSDVSSSLFSGSDHWSNQSSGTFTVNPDGTSVSSQSYIGSSSGNDTYSDSDVYTTLSVTADKTGSTSVYNVSTTTDTGFDEYQQSGFGTVTVTADGTITETDSHNNTADGNSTQSQTDSGWQQSDATLSDGTVVNFHSIGGDSSVDKSHYSSSDVLVASTASGGTDVSSYNSGGNSTFSSSSRVSETDSLTNPYGTPTVTKTVSSSGDTGTSVSSSTSSDIQTLGVGKTILSDVSTFSSSSSEQDLATSQTTSTTTTNGQVGVGETLVATESFSESDTTHSTNIYTDSGTSTWLPTGYTESDTSTETSTTSGQTQASSSFTATDTATLSSGASMTRILASTSSDTGSNSLSSTSTDIHTESSNADGSSLVVNDDNKFNSSSVTSDDYTQTSNSSLNSVTPVAGGSIHSTSTTSITTTGTSGATHSLIGETNTANPSVNNVTASISTTNHDHGTQTSQDSLTMNATDPKTGVVTTIQSGGISTDHFTDTDGSSMTVTTTYGNSTPAVSGQSHSTSTDDIVGSSSQSVSVVGNPSPGVSIDYSIVSSATNHGVSSDTRTMTFTAIGTLSGSDVFSSVNDETSSSSGHSNVSQALSTDDGHGNTSSISDWSRTVSSETGTSRSSNSGSETYSYANGQLASDDVSETSTQNGQSNPTQTVTTSNNDHAVSVDPTTGLVTTASRVASSSDTTSSHNVFTSSVVHTASLTNAGTDVTSGTDTNTGTEQASDTYRNTVTLLGLLPTGENVNITNVYVQADNSQDGFTIASAWTPDGTVTNTNSVTGTFNIPTIYDAQYGTVSTTDPTTGIMTTTTSVNVIDSKSTDSVANVHTSAIVATGNATITPANSDLGTLHQAWSLTTITSQTNAAGQPIGTVTTTSDVGFATESKLNGVVTDPGLTNSPTSTTTAAGSTSTATLPIPNPGDLFTGQQAGAGSGPLPGSSQQPANQQATTAQKAAQKIQIGAQKENESSVFVPGGAAGGDAVGGAFGAQKLLGGAMPANGQAPPPVQQPGAAPAGQTPPSQAPSLPMSQTAMVQWLISYSPASIALWTQFISSGGTVQIRSASLIPWRSTNYYDATTGVIYTDGTGPGLKTALDDYASKMTPTLFWRQYAGAIGALDGIRQHTTYAWGNWTERWFTNDPTPFIPLDRAAPKLSPEDYSTGKNIGAWGGVLWNVASIYKGLVGIKGGLQGTARGGTLWILGTDGTIIALPATAAEIAAVRAAAQAGAVGVLEFEAGLLGANSVGLPPEGADGTPANVPPIRTGRWGKGSFATAAESLEYHFAEHGAEVGATNVDQYLRKAEGFAQNLRGATKSPVDGATPGVIRYKKLGKYIDIDREGNIISFGTQ